MSENKRDLLACFIRDRVRDQGRTIRDFAAALAEILPGSRKPERVEFFVRRVVQGAKAIPPGEEGHWAKALKLREGPERAEFLALVSGARAWGEKYGRAYLSRLEDEAAALRARAEKAEHEATRLRSEHVRIVAEQEAMLTQMRAELDRLRPSKARR